MDEFADFEKLGEDEMRLRLAKGMYNAQKTQMIRLWLQKNQKSRDEASREEELSIMRDMATSASSAADSAKEALRQAKNAKLFAGVTAAIAAVVATYEHWERIKSVFVAFTQ